MSHTIEAAGVGPQQSNCTVHVWVKPPIPENKRSASDDALNRAAREIDAYVTIRHGNTKSAFSYIALGVHGPKCSESNKERHKMEVATTGSGLVAKVLGSLGLKTKITRVAGHPF